LESPFFPLSFCKNFMKIRSAVPENGCLIFCGGRKKQKKTKKTSVKHIRISLAEHQQCTCPVCRHAHDDDARVSKSVRSQDSWYTKRLVAVDRSHHGPETEVRLRGCCDIIRFCRIPARFYQTLYTVRTRSQGRNCRRLVLITLQPVQCILLYRPTHRVSTVQNYFCQNFVKNFYQL